MEDSINGVRAAKAAGMLCVAVPAVGADDGIAAEAISVLGSIGELDDGMWARRAVRSGPVSHTERMAEATDERDTHR